VQSGNEQEILTNLGLTVSQAKVYLALIRNGPSKVMKLSEETGIHRAHLYEILHSLQDNGFIEKSLEHATFAPVSISEVAPILVNRKREEIKTLEEEIKHIAEYSPQISELIYKRDVVLTSNKNLTLNKVEKFIDSSITQMRTMHTWKRFYQSWQHFELPLKEAMDRGVKAKHVVEFPSDAKQAKRFLNQKLFTHKNFELRFVPKTGGNFTIVDQKMLLLPTNLEKEKLGETPFIFSNYEGLIGLMSNYFETAWNNGADFKEYIKNLEQTLP
jgi:sugar-specific transcriptional regulator TrmB